MFNVVEASKEQKDTVGRKAADIVRRFVGKLRSMVARARQARRRTVMASKVSKEAIRDKLIDSYSEIPEEPPVLTERSDNSPTKGRREAGKAEEAKQRKQFNKSLTILKIDKTPLRTKMTLIGESPLRAKAAELSANEKKSNKKDKERPAESPDNENIIFKATMDVLLSKYDRRNSGSLNMMKSRADAERTESHLEGLRIMGLEKKRKEIEEILKTRFKRTMDLNRKPNLVLVDPNQEHAIENIKKARKKYYLQKKENSTILMKYSSFAEDVVETQIIKYLMGRDEEELVMFLNNSKMSTNKAGKRMLNDLEREISVINKERLRLLEAEKGKTEQSEFINKMVVHSRLRKLLSVEQRKNSGKPGGATFPSGPHKEIVLCK